MAHEEQDLVESALRNRKEAWRLVVLGSVLVLLGVAAIQSIRARAAMVVPTTCTMRFQQRDALGVYSLEHVLDGTRYWDEVRLNPGDEPAPAPALFKGMDTPCVYYVADPNKVLLQTPQHEVWSTGWMAVAGICVGTGLVGVVAQVWLRRRMKTIRSKQDDVPPATEEVVRVRLSRFGMARAILGLLFLLPSVMAAVFLVQLLWTSSLPAVDAGLALGWLVLPFLVGSLLVLFHRSTLVLDARTGWAQVQRGVGVVWHRCWYPLSDLVSADAVTRQHRGRNISVTTHHLVLKRRSTPDHPVELEMRNREEAQQVMGRVYRLICTRAVKRGAVTT